MMKLGTTEKLIISMLSKKEWVSIKDLIGLLGRVNRSESAVRATLFRLRQKGLVSPSKEGRETRYRLSERGQELKSSFKIRLAKAEERWEGKWLLLSFNIPEKRRTLRNLLRARLGSLGFGRLHTNLWISPYDLREKCRKIVQELGVEKYVEMFMTSYVGEDPRILTRKAWSIEDLTKMYQKLLPKYRKMLSEFQKKSFEDDSQAGLEALLRTLELVEELAELVEKDPMLPAELLPPQWVGFETRKTIMQYLRVLGQRAPSIAEFDYLINAGKLK